MLPEMCVDVQRCCKKVPQRYILALMCFLGLFAAFAMRGCLSIAITEMVEPTDKTDAIFMDETCIYDDVIKSPTVSVNKTAYKWKETYDWDEYTQGLILSSFYWGYVISHIPGGIIADKYGGKHTMGIGILLTAVFTILTPTAIYIGNSTALIGLRALMGLGEGTTYPAINVLLAQWTPPGERSRTAAFVYAGALLGTIFATTISGWILQTSAMGWPLVFYVMGIISVLWFIIWLFTCYNNPRDHPYITQNEVDYLKERMNEHTHEKPPPTPWKHILLSKALWAVIIAKIGFGWSILSLVSDLPKFMSGVLKFSVAINGYLTSLIYLFMWLGSSTSSCLADYLITKDHMSTSTVRKVGSVLSLSISASFIVTASHVGCDRVLVVAMLIVAMTLMGTAYPSVMMNSLDLSPNYAGTLMALTNGVSAATGIAGPYIIGVLTPNQSLTEWQLVFWILFGVAVFSNIVFLLFGSGEVQNWNDPEFLMQETNEYRKKSIESGKA